jgi:predicted DNA binding CopG/RHH family protein
VRADAYINCRVTSETKAVLRMMASREGITESALVKQLLGAVLRTSAIDELPSSPTEGRRRNRDSRLTLRLAPEDLTLLQERAGARSMASATYAAVLLRSHLRNAVPLPKEELLALKRSIAELSAIGRNLNQIARAVNSGKRVSLPGRQELLTMLKIGEGLREHVKALLKANTASWRGNAELAH